MKATRAAGPCAAESAFLAAIAAHPAEDGPRLVYADWLEERGEAARAEFIRVQCQLAIPAFKSYGIALRRRERELLAGSGWGAWLPALPGLAWRLDSDPLNRDDPGYVGCTFSRGFVSSVTLTAAQLCGGPCARCEGDGFVQTMPDGTVVPSADCPACGGAGRAPGCAAALGRLPGLERVTLSDREPDRFPDSWWWFREGNRAGSGRATLPAGLFDATYRLARPGSKWPPGPRQSALSLTAGEGGAGRLAAVLGAGAVALCRSAAAGAGECPRRDGRGGTRTYTGYGNAESGSCDAC